MPGRFAISLLLLLVAHAGAAEASERFAGRWRRTSYRVKVTIESWGDDCGPRPKSSGTTKVVETDAVAQGQHLVFTKGNLRTNQCVSPNPRLQTVSQSAAAGNWKWVCQTAKSDPKFERGEYSLTASGNNKLNFRGRSKFNWKLNESSCVAEFDETRVFVRDTADDPGAETEEPGGDSTAGCAEHGPLKRLTITPRETKIGPGERVCFKAIGHDEGGCRFTVGASWTAQQDGQEVGGLLSRGGCFSAGATAAESEGSYDIVARAEGKTATARVLVDYPDLGDLLAARLNPAEDVDPAAGAAPQPVGPGVGGTPPPVPVAAGPPVAPAGDARGNLVLIVIVAAGIVLAVGLLALALVLRRKRRPRLADDDDWLDDPLARSSTAPPEYGSAKISDEPPAPAPSTPAAAPTETTLVCPKCGETFPTGSRFCPHDGSTLTPAAIQRGGSDASSGGGAGMVCPRCHRGYDPGAKFCPHDSEKLVPYPEWRERNRGRP